MGILSLKGVAAWAGVIPTVIQFIITDLMVSLDSGGFLLPFSTCTLLPLSVRNVLFVCNQHTTIIHK